MQTYVPKPSYREPTGRSLYNSPEKKLCVMYAMHYE